MTGPSPSGHLDLDALADVLAGERTGERHLRACATCEERLADLEGAEVAVVASLATLPPPVLPDGLAERLAAALREEASHSATTAGASRPAAGPALRSVPTSTRVADARRARRRRTASWLPAVAAAAALVLAGGFGLDALTRTGADSASSDTAAGGASDDAAEPDVAQESGAVTPDQLAALAGLGSSGADYADPAQREAALPRVLAASATDPSAFVSASAAPQEDGPSTAAPQASAPQPPAPAVPGSGAASRALGDLETTALDRLREPAALAECLAALRGEGAPAADPLALDAAAFGGAPALAVVQPDPDPARLALTVVGPGCSAGDTDTLLRTRVARP